MTKSPQVCDVIFPPLFSPGLDLDLLLRLWPLPLVVVGVVEDAVEDLAVRRLLAIVLP